MAETTNLNIRIDKDLKERAEAVFADMGMSMTTAFNIFVRQTLRQGKILSNTTLCTPCLASSFCTRSK